MAYLSIALFVEYFEIGLTILGGAASLSFLNLPVLTRVSEESIRAVPKELMSASFALGGTHLQTIMRALLPASTNGIITGICLVAGRAFGESAVIILIAGVSTSGEIWDFSLFSPGATLFVHSFWERCRTEMDTISCDFAGKSFLPYCSSHLDTFF